MRDVLLFDLDGTLVDSGPAIAEALSRVRRHRGGDPVDTDLVRSLVSRGVNILVSEALGPLAQDPAADIAAFRTELADIDDPDAVFDGVEPTLRALHRRGLRMGVVTNKPEAMSRALLARYRLLDLFQTIIGGDTANHPKPHPAPIMLALSHLKAAPDDAIFVGDSSVDAQAAKAAGVPFLFFEGGYERLDRQRRSSAFSSYGQLSSAIEQING